MAVIRGTARLISSPSEQGTEFGRVDIPPISRIAGGSGESITSLIRSSARGTERCERSPSEKESGVALKICMIMGKRSRRSGGAGNGKAMMGASCGALFLRI